MAFEKKLNRDVIKYIAIFAMFLNHFAHAFLVEGTFIYELFVDIGYFTAITMCYFLVEGYHYTHSKKKYALRLLVFALISQIPYLLLIKYVQFNMLFTLLFCFCFLWVSDSNLSKYIIFILQIVLVVLCLFSDWSIMAWAFVYLFEKNRNAAGGINKAYRIIIWLYFVMCLMNFNALYGALETFIRSVGACVGLILSEIIIIYFYNGKKGEKMQKFSKWFFYIFYPLHLIVLLIIQQIFNINL